MTPDPQDVKPLPCQFCKGIGKLTPVSGGWCVECDECHARGPKVILAEGALGEWNRRAPSPSTGGASSRLPTREVLAEAIEQAGNDYLERLMSGAKPTEMRFMMADAVLALCGDAHGGGTEEIECEECGGRGYHVGPICCGNLTKGGECRGECAVPEQTQCDVCEGSGRVEISESEGSSGAPST